MYREITKSAFHDAFSGMDRGYDFSYEAKNALFNYLESYEESTGEKIELDVIALCSEFTEWSSCTEAASEYFEFEGMTFGEEGEELESVEEVEEKARKFLEDRTQLIEFDGGVIIQNF